MNLPLEIFIDCQKYLLKYLYLLNYIEEFILDFLIRKNNYIDYNWDYMLQ